MLMRASLMLMMLAWGGGGGGSEGPETRWKRGKYRVFLRVARKTVQKLLVMAAVYARSAKPRRKHVFLAKTLVSSCFWDFRPPPPSR